MMVGLGTQTMGHEGSIGTSMPSHGRGIWLFALVLMVGCDSKPNDGQNYITEADEPRHRATGLEDGRKDALAGEAYSIHRRNRPEARLTSVRVGKPDGAYSFSSDGLNPYERGYQKGYTEGACEKVRSTDEWKGGLFNAGLEVKEKAGAVLEAVVKSDYPPCKVVIWLKTEATRGYPYEFDVKTLRVVNLQENVGLGRSYGIEPSKAKK